MENLSMTITISKSEEKLMLFEENYEGKLSSLNIGLRNLKISANNFLTELINKEKGTENHDLSHNCKISCDNSDENIDSEKDSFLSEESLSSFESFNQNEKRAKTKIRENKKLKN